MVCDVNKVGRELCMTEFCLESEGKILRYLSINPTGASGLGFLWDYLGVREGTGGRATIGVIETRESCT